MCLWAHIGTEWWPKVEVQWFPRGTRDFFILGEHCHEPSIIGWQLPSRRGKSTFSPIRELCEHLLVLLGDQSWAVWHCYRLILMVSLLGYNKGMSRSGGM